MTTLLKQFQLNYFDPTENSNKVWIGKAYDNGKFETYFGRVRENGFGMMKSEKQLASGNAALIYLEQKRNEKIRKGYRDTAVLENSAEVITSKPAELKQIAVQQIGGTSDSTTAELIKYLADVNIHAITHSTSIKYDSASATFKTPLGVLTPNAILEARDLLNQIRKANDKGLVSSSRHNLVCDYYRLVPSDFGFRIPPTSSLLDSMDKIAKQNDILDALNSAISVSAPTAVGEKIFKCTLTKLPHFTEDGRKKFREIKALYEKTLNSHHSTSKLVLKRVYEVEIEDMKANFETTAQKLGNVRADLWHGTRASNLLSILKSGLIIPPSNSSHCTGRMFGNGIYTSLQSTKALNYATDFWNGSGSKNQKTFMFLTEVALGKMDEPKNRTGIFPRRGCDSTWVEAGTCGVLNHEAIVYDTKQINLKYLCEFGTV